MKHYLLVTWGGVQPELLGPFPTAAERDKQAAQIHAENEEDGVYRLDAVGDVSVGPYGGGEMDELIEEHQIEPGADILVDAV